VSEKVPVLQHQTSNVSEVPEQSDLSQRSTLSRGSSTDTIMASPKIIGTDDSRDFSIEISSDSLRVEIGEQPSKLEFVVKSSENQKSFDRMSESPRQSPISRDSSTDTVLESPKKKTFDKNLFERSKLESPEDDRPTEFPTSTNQVNEQSCQMFQR